MRIAKTKPKPGKLAAAGIASLLGLGLLLPLALLAMLSLGRRWVFPDLMPREWTIEHWRDLLSGSAGLGQSLLLSLLLATVVAGTATVLGFFSARQVVRSRAGGRALLAAYGPYVLSPVIYAVLLQVFFLKLGLSGTIPGVMLGQLLLTYPFAVILMQSFWDARAVDFEQLGKTLGCSGTLLFRRVLLPLARPILTLCFFQSFLISWFEFGLTNLLGLGQVKTLTVLVFAFIQEANPHYAALASLLLIGPPALLVLINRRALAVGGQDLYMRPPEKPVHQHERSGRQVRISNTKPRFSRLYQGIGTAK